MNLRATFLFLLLPGTLASVALAEPKPARVVEAATKPGDKWVAYPTRTLADLVGGADIKPDAGLSQYGGLASRREKVTGFFHTTNRNGRWWLVDPEGCLFLHRGVASVSLPRAPGAQAAWKEKFGSETNWAQRTTDWLRTNSFNGLGAWADSDRLRAANPPLVYTRIWNFMSGYGKKRGGTHRQPGHTGYPNDCIFVFDPGFEEFCDEQAKQLEAGKDDPWLLGHFSDNELPFRREALRNYLALPTTDAGQVAARAFLTQRHGAQATARDITPEDEQDFLGMVAARYFQIVSRAIKKHDPNHLYLGSRFHGQALRLPELFKACGGHVDVVSVNYYHAWTPDPDRLAMWERESGRPVLITEWYAKGADSGLANTSGAGWLVKSQRERGMFYENFTLALLESRVCVGWDWFKYIDNDPADAQADPSNQDSNKGILSNRYEPYRPLLDSMKRINERTYGLVDYLAKTNRQTGLKVADVDNVFDTHHHDDHWFGLVHFPEARWFAAPRKLPTPSIGLNGWGVDIDIDFLRT
jgi:hypothetical protein